MRSKITIFIVKIIVLYLFWYIVSELLVDTKFWQALNSIVLREILFFSKYSLKVLGLFLNFTVQTIPSNGISWAPHDTLIFYKGDITYRNLSELFINNRCLALDLMYAFSVFIIAFFGPVKKKLWFIPMGILIINTLNILRIIGLGITVMYFPKYINFNHHTLFTYIVYMCTFILWVIWIKRYAKDDIIKLLEDIKEKERLKNIAKS
jgi:exosortase/archaeosortase family protein